MSMDNRKPHILVVDDEPVNREVAGLLMDDVGIVVDNARA
jgi:CheY-like chemotaxis protein